MASKYKLTGCARFLIFFIIVAPLVYFGVTFYTGNDPMSPFENIELPSLKKDNSGTVSEENIRNEALKVKDERILELEQRIEDLETIIEQQKTEIKRLRE